MQLELLGLLARLAQLPQAGVQVCGHVDTQDIVFVLNPITLSRQPFWRALHKLQVMPEAMPSGAPWPTMMQEEAAAGNLNEMQLVQNLCRIGLRALVGYSKADKVEEGNSARQTIKTLITDPLVADLFSACLATGHPDGQMTATDFCSHPVFIYHDLIYLVSLLVELGNIEQDPAGSPEQQRAQQLIQTILNKLDRLLASSDVIRVRLGGLEGMLWRLLQYWSLFNKRGSKGTGDDGKALLYKLSSLLEVCRCFRCLYVHRGKAAHGTLKNIRDELQAYPGDTILQLIARVILPRFLKCGPPAPKGLGTWEVPLQGQVKRALQQLALELHHELRQAWPQLREYHDRLRPFVKSCAGGNVAAWCDAAPAGSKRAVSFTDVLNRLRKASPTREPGPAAAPTGAAAAGPPAAAAEVPAAAAAEAAEAGGVSGKDAAAETVQEAVSAAAAAGHSPLPPGQPMLTAVPGPAPSAVDEELLRAQGFRRVMKPFLHLRCNSLVGPELASLSTCFMQEVMLPGLPILPAATKAVLTLDMQRGGAAYTKLQVERLIMACLLQGCVGPLLLQLLQAAISLMLQAGDHPMCHAMVPGLCLKNVMDLLKCLLLQPDWMEGTPAATLDALEDGLLWWAMLHTEARSAADKVSLSVPDGAAATTKVIYQAVVAEDWAAAVKAFNASSHASKAQWIKRNTTGRWQVRALEAAAAAKAAAAAAAKAAAAAAAKAAGAAEAKAAAAAAAKAAGAAEAKTAAPTTAPAPAAADSDFAGCLTVAEALDIAGLNPPTHVDMPRSYFAAGPCMPAKGDWSADPLQPKAGTTQKQLLDSLMSQAGYKRASAEQDFYIRSEQQPEAQCMRRACHKAENALSNQAQAERPAAQPVTGSSEDKGKKQRQHGRPGTVVVEGAAVAAAAAGSRPAANRDAAPAGGAHTLQRALDRKKQQQQHNNNNNNNNSSNRQQQQQQHGTGQAGTTTGQTAAARHKPQQRSTAAPTAGHGQNLALPAAR